jgi:hypothetical protein
LFEPRRDITIGHRTKKGVLYIERLRDLCSSTNISRVIKSRKIKGVGHATRIGEKINAHKALVGKHTGKY